MTIKHASTIIYDGYTQVASNYSNGRPGSLRVAQFAGGTSIIEISSRSVSAQIHAHAGELRAFAARLIAAADAFDAQQVAA